jgi:hypothetical protein
MTRVVSVGRSKGLLLASALGTVVFASILAGCPGTLDPSQFPLSGAAGMPGGMAGTTGAAGSLPGCDVSNLVTTKYACSVDSVCHGAKDPAANLDMVTAGWEASLVGTVPKGGGVLAKSICFDDPAFKTMPYIVKGSYPATGLLMTKLKMATCVNPAGTKGALMPSGAVAPMPKADMDCFQAFADKLAAAP